MVVLSPTKRQRVTHPIHVTPTASSSSIFGRGFFLVEVMRDLVLVRPEHERHPLAALAGLCIEVLMLDALRLDRQQDQIARLPVDTVTVDRRVPFALEHEEHEPALV